MATNAAPLERAAKELSLSVDTLASANEDWLTSAIVLIPVILRPELLKAIGHSTGNTTFYRKLALSVGLKEAKLQVIANHFKNLLDYKEAYRNIDIKNAPISRIQNIHKNAIAIAGGKKKLTLDHVKTSVKQAVENNEIDKSKIDYIEDIDRQISFANAMDTDALENGMTIENESAKVESSTKEEKPKSDVAKEKSPARSKTVQKQTQAKKPAQKAEAKKPTQKAEAKEPVAEKEAIERTSAKATKAAPEIAKAEPEANISGSSAQDEKTDVAAEASQSSDAKVEKTTKQEAVTRLLQKSNAEPVEQEVKAAPTLTDTVAETESAASIQSNLVKEFLTLSPEDKALIVEIATAFHGDHNLAMLRACSDTQAGTLLKSIQRIK